MTPIQEKHESLLNGGLSLGDVLGPEEALYDGGTRQLYEFGAIWFHPRLGGAFECHGAILERYLQRSAEMSALGYPTSDEEDDPALLGGRQSRFENGVLRWNLLQGVTMTLDEPPGDPPPRVLVKVFDDIPLALARGVATSLDDLVAAIAQPGQDAVVAAIAAALPGLTVRLVFDAVMDGELEALLARAREDPTYAPPRFENFLAIDCPDGFDTAPLVDALMQWTGVVECAYDAGIASDPSVVAVRNLYYTFQGYLEGGGKGVGVEAAWRRGLDGAGTSFIDVEQGWFLRHVDLPRGIRLLEGSNSKDSHYHGTAVLGIIVAVDDDKGIVGIAPRASASVISYNDLGPSAFPDERDSAAVALMKAAILLRPGDVVLLEVQHLANLDGPQRRWPVEADLSVLRAIEVATAAGIIVVEPAGNGIRDLDALVINEKLKDGTTVARRRLSRGTPAAFVDSGAIVVGACSSAMPHQRWVRPTKGDGTNFGSRIDCYAWGEDIVTTGGLDDQAHVEDSYYLPTEGFGGTSGASAIITGVCLLVQQLHTVLRPTEPPLNGRRMREILSNRRNGTLSARAADRIGVMPDFSLIARNEFP